MFTETKLATDPAIAHLTSRYPFRYFGADPKKGYAGVACLSKIEPLSVVYGVPSDTIGGYQDITKGRLITLEFPTTYVLIGYSPNAGAGLKEMPRKVEWNAAFEIYLRQLDGVKPVVWCGDQNVVPTEQDIRNWKTNYNKSAGVTQIEIDAYNRQLNPPAESGHGKLTDAWRKLHPDTVGVYSYYSYRFACRSVRFPAAPCSPDTSSRRGSATASTSSSSRIVSYPLSRPARSGASASARLTIFPSCWIFLSRSSICSLQPLKFHAPQPPTSSAQSSSHASGDAVFILPGMRGCTARSDMHACRTSFDGRTATSAFSNDSTAGVSVGKAGVDGLERGETSGGRVSGSGGKVVSVSTRLRMRTNDGP